MEGNQFNQIVRGALNAMEAFESKSFHHLFEQGSLLNDLQKDELLSCYDEIARYGWVKEQTLIDFSENEAGVLAKKLRRVIRMLDGDPSEAEGEIQDYIRGKRTLVEKYEGPIVRGDGNLTKNALIFCYDMVTKYPEK